MSFAARLAAMAIAGSLLSGLTTTILIRGIAESISDTSAETARGYGLATLRDLVEGYSGIGLELDRMTALQTIIERDKSLDPSILSIDIFGRDGRIVYSTDPAGIGLDVPPQWEEHGKTIARGQAPPQSSFLIKQRDEVITGSVVLDTIGQPMATIVVTGTQTFTSRRDLDLRIIAGGLVAGLVTAVLACLAGLGIARRVTEDIAAATQVLAGRDGARPGTGGLIDMATVADAVWAEAESAIGTAFRELEQLDEAV